MSEIVKTACSCLSQLNVTSLKVIEVLLFNVTCEKKASNPERAKAGNYFFKSSTQELLITKTAASSLKHVAALEACCILFVCVSSDENKTTEDFAASITNE